MLSVVLEIVVYLDMGSVGRLAVGCKALREVVKESKFGGEHVLMECRRLLRVQRVGVSRQVGGDVCARVVDACAAARGPLCDLVALGWRITESSEVVDVKKWIMEAGNRLTELMGWCEQRCLGRVRGAVAVDAQLGHDGREMKLIQWPLDQFWPLDVE